MVGNVNSELLKGVGVLEIAKELGDAIWHIRDHQMEGIAWTEINSAQNIGAFQTYELAGTEYL